MAPKKKALAAPADLADLDSVMERQEEGTTVPIYHMDGRTPLGFGIVVAGPDSKRGNDARAAMTREIQDWLLARDVDQIDDAANEAIQTRFLARLCIRFDGAAVLDKRKLEDTEEDFYRLLSRKSMRFIRQQVDRVWADRTRFLEDTADDSSEKSEGSTENNKSASQATEDPSGSSSGASAASTTT